MADAVRRRYLISGRVQGVGYRRFVERNAQALGLSGGVRNLIDGRVEAWVSGSAAQHDQLLIELRRGPMLSKVSDIKIDDVGSNWSVLYERQSFRVFEDGEEPWSIQQS